MQEDNDQAFRVPNTKMYHRGRYEDQNTHQELTKSKAPNGQVQYLGRFVDRATFRAFVYKVNEQKLMKSYEEYEHHIMTGEWFCTLEDAHGKSNKLAEEVQEKAVVEPTSVKSPDPIIEAARDPRSIVNANQFRKNKNGTVG